MDMNNLKNDARYAWYRTKEGVGRTWEWCKQHPAEALTIATGLLTGIGVASRGIARLGSQIQDMREVSDQRKRIWNPVAGEYLYTKRPLTGMQKLEFEERIRSGESRASILDSMGVLDKRR